MSLLPGPGQVIRKIWRLPPNANGDNQVSMTKDQMLIARTMCRWRGPDADGEDRLLPDSVCQKAELAAASASVHPSSDTLNEAQDLPAIQSYHFHGELHVSDTNNPAKNRGIAICVPDLAQPKNKDHSLAQTAQKNCWIPVPSLPGGAKS